MADRCSCHDFLLVDCERTRDAALREFGEAKAAADRRFRLLDLPGVSPARFAGGCGQCGEHFPVGTAIKAFGDPLAEPTWVAECCLDDLGKRVPR